MDLIDITDRLYYGNPLDEGTWDVYAAHAASTWPECAAHGAMAYLAVLAGDWDAVGAAYATYREEIEKALRERLERARDDEDAPSEIPAYLAGTCVVLDRIARAVAEQDAPALYLLTNRLPFADSAYDEDQDDEDEDEDTDEEHDLPDADPPHDEDEDTDEEPDGGDEDTYAHVASLLRRHLPHPPAVAAIRTGLPRAASRPYGEAAPQSSPPRAWPTLEMTFKVAGEDPLATLGMLAQCPGTATPEELEDAVRELEPWTGAGKEALAAVWEVSTGGESMLAILSAVGRLDPALDRLCGELEPSGEFRTPEQFGYEREVLIAEALRLLGEPPPKLDELRAVLVDEES